MDILSPPRTSETTQDQRAALTFAAVIRANRERRETPRALFADWAHI